MTIVLLLVIFTLTALVKIYNHKKSTRWWYHVNKIRGPKPLPLLGNAHELGNTSTDILKNIERIWNRYGCTTFKLVLGDDAFIMLSDPQLIENILTNENEISKLSDYVFMLEWLGEGMLLSSGKKWRRKRKIVTPFFNVKLLEQFLSVFDNNTDILIKKLMEKKHRLIDVHSYITLCALDIICESAMGVSIDAQLKDQSKYVKAVNSITDIIHRRSCSFWKRYDFLYAFSLDRFREKRALSVLHQMTNCVINMRKIILKEELQKTMNDSLVGPNPDNSFVESQKERIAFMDLLLISKTLDGKKLTDQEIKDEVNTFLFEGHAKTASALSFALYELANNTKIQDMAFKEQYCIFGNDRHRKCTMGDIEEMTYLERVIAETLRLYPTVPFFGRKLKNGVVLPDKTILPRDCYVVILQYCMNRNPKYHQNPTKFDPDRFLPENVAKYHEYLHIPFSSGLRNCIGQKFAIHEMKCVLSKLLRNFELLSGGPGIQPQLAAELILKSKNGIHISIRDRTYPSSKVVPDV